MTLPKKEVECRCCGKHLVGQQRIYCSKVCSIEHKNAVVDNGLKCLYCGISLNGIQRKYCSGNHKNSANHKINGYKYHNRYRSKDPKSFINALLGFYKRRDTLSLDFVFSIYEKQNGSCALSKVPMTHIVGLGKITTNISIDRIDSDLGYEESNVQLVCVMANKMKQDMTNDEFKYWIAMLHANL
jgi:hypothetical protein